MGAYCTIDSLINVPLFNNSNSERYHLEVKKKLSGLGGT